VDAAFYAADGVVGSIPLPRRGGCSVLCCRRGSRFYSPSSKGWMQRFMLQTG